MPTSQPPETPVDICNLALSHVGERTISSIESPDTKPAELCALWYDQTRRTVLREQVWNFAQKYDTLVREASTDDRYTDMYALPNDFVRLNGIGSDIYDPLTEYDLMAGYIVANYDGAVLPIRYNQDITHVPHMDALFINYLALRLAQAIAYPITKKKSVVDYITSLVAQAEPKTTSVDGQERPPRRVQRSVYLAARRGATTSGWDTTRYDLP